MVQRYTPRIKATTAKSMAKSLLSTQSGKKVSDTKFKEHLKQNKDLKKYAYKGKASTISSADAKKMFNKVVESAKGSEKFKISHAAKKLGIKGDRKAGTATINKIYGKAGQEELASQPQQTGPTKQELRQQKRHEDMMKTFHKRDRADETRQEQEEERKDAEKNASGGSDSKKGGGTASTRPSAGSGGVAGSTTTQNLSQQTATSSATPSDQRPATQKSDQAEEKPITALILPLSNLSPNVRDLDSIVTRLSTTVKQLFTTLHILPLLPESAIQDALNNLRLEAIPDATDYGAIAALAKAAQAQLVIFGSVSQTGTTLTINVQFANVATDKKLDLANLKEGTDDIFNIERKLRWHIENALNSGQNEPKKPGETPPTDEAVDLPI